MSSSIFNVLRCSLNTPARNIIYKHITHENRYVTKHLYPSYLSTRTFNTSQSVQNKDTSFSWKHNFEHSSNSYSVAKIGIAILAGTLISAEIYRRSKITIQAQEIQIQTKERILYEPTRKLNADFMLQRTILLYVYDTSDTKRLVANDPMNTTGLKLTLYQYESCPFCCKVRAMLDYYGMQYDVIEVETLSRKELKWSSYKKVPLLVLEGVGSKGYSELGDSTMSLSLLETYLRNPSQNIERVISFYPTIENKDKNGKIKFEFPNKYFVMHGEKEIDVAESKSNIEERKWRQWNDDVLIHVISPNLYRTVDEASYSIKQFAKSGNWEEINNSKQYWFIMKLGPYAMWLLGKKLKSKYNLKDDVRHSLYDACNQWTKALGKKNFMGGDKPNLADISVYGTLFCMEGCPVFDDMKNNTKIMNWYMRMKSAVKNKSGAKTIATA